LRTASPLDVPTPAFLGVNMSRNVVGAQAVIVKSRTAGAQTETHITPSA